MVESLNIAFCIQLTNPKLPKNLKIDFNNTVFDLIFFFRFIAMPKRKKYARKIYLFNSLVYT